MIQSDITLGKEEGSGEISPSDSFSADIFYTKNLIHKLTMPSAESWSVFRVCPENPSEPLGVWNEVTQSCPTLCDPVGCSLPGSSVHGILQARILEWVAIPSPGDLPNPGIKPGSPTLKADSLLSEPPGKPNIHMLQKQILFHAHLPYSKASLSMEFSRQEYWSG